MAFNYGLPTPFRAGFFGFGQNTNSVQTASADTVSVTEKKTNSAMRRGLKALLIFGAYTGFGAALGSIVGPKGAVIGAIVGAVFGIACAALYLNGTKDKNEEAARV